MRPTGGAKSKERSSSYTKKSPSANKLPANYKPPHLRNNYVANVNRVSPGVPRTGI